jgi:hypothetical protein
VVPDFRRRAGERSCSCDGHPERGANDLWVIAPRYSPIGRHRLSPIPNVGQ